MYIIRKEGGKEPEVIKVNRDFIKKLKKSHEIISIAKGVVIALDPDETFDDGNYNCTLRIPENDGKIYAFGTFYLIRKRVFLGSFNPQKVSFIFSGLFLTSKKPEHWWD